MSTGTGTSLKRSSAATQAAKEVGKAKQTTQSAAKKETAAEDARFANIQANLFYKVMFDQAGVEFGEDALVLSLSPFTSKRRICFGPFFLWVAPVSTM